MNQSDPWAKNISCFQPIRTRLSVMCQPLKEIDVTKKLSLSGCVILTGKLRGESLETQNLSLYGKEHLQKGGKRGIFYIFFAFISRLKEAKCYCSISSRQVCF